ncbi:hypothetical protein M3Y94_01157300 [Aphelenchoides besseyi]|nr:hypothetical protein M3Y94_01157300 [Aphelenchoides besseyi]
MRFFSRLLIERLKAFFTANDLGDGYLTSLSCFFHLPLSRQLAGLEMQYFSTNGCCEVISKDDQEFVLMHLFIYPLRIQATIAEYQAGMWIRSGNAIRASIIVYQQMGFSHGFLDFDLSIMRIAASKLDSDRITEMLFDAFHVQECLNYPFDVEELDSDVPLTVQRRSWVTYLIDGYLKLLLELILVQTFAELKNEEVQKEIIQSIISEDEPVYSKIRAGKTEHRVTDEEFNQMLNNVANFVEPDRSNTNRQGHYELKKDVWKELSLVRARHRSCSPREYNTILNRMEQALTAFMPRNEDKRHIWPLYCLPNFDDDAPIISTSRILPNERNVLVCQFVLEWFLSHDAPLHLLQQAIFVLTLMLKLTKSKRARSLKTSDWDIRHFDVFGSSENELSFETNCANFYKRFTTRPTNVVFEKMKKPLSILELLIQTFTKLHLNELLSHNEYTARKRLKEQCQKLLSEMDRLIGTGSDYVARTIAWLYYCDKNAKDHVDSQVFTLLTEPTSETSNEIQKKRLIAKEKQMAILKMQQKKHSALMEKLMASEGMNDESLEETGIQYGECSICNSREHGVGKWFGVLTAMQSTSFEAGSYCRDYETYQMWEETAIPTFLTKRAQNCPTYNLLPYAELKTCGHLVHLDCYTSYEESPLSHAHPLSFSISCPVCRGRVHAIIPLLPAGQLLPSVNLATQMDTNHSKSDLKSFESEIEEFRQALNAAPEIRSTLANYYEEFLGKKLGQFFKLRAYFIQSMASKISARIFDSIYHENMMFTSLSLIKNWIDRICLMQIEEVEFPLRLHQKITKPMYFSSIFYVATKPCAEILLDFYDHLTLNQWSNKKSNSKVLPILHYDSQTVITIMASNLILCNDSTTADQLGYFRVLYSYILFHCLTRTVVLELLKKPNHQRLNFLQQLYGNLKDDVFGISKALQWMKTIEEETGVLRSTTTYWQRSENENEITPDQFIDDLKQLLYRFAHFSFNLAVELELFSIDQLSKWNARMSFEDAFHFFNNSILSEPLQLDQICLLVNGHSNRLHLWITSFTQNLSVELKPYYANNGLWIHRKIMHLPDSYETFFNENFGRQCTRCSTVPAQPMICLLCGLLTCLDSCCLSNFTFVGHQVSEVERHAYSCGSACGIFLCLTSGVVVITHGPLVNIFGSIYLDAHGEEDRNLRRGRPLTLSAVRLRRLNDLWISHDFDRNVNNSQGWLLFEHLSSVLRECHNML